MSYTVQYLQSELAAQGIEVSVLVNCLVQDAIRLGASELLLVNEPFREAVLKKLPTSALEEIAIQQGMRTLWQNGLARAIAGQTTLEETIRVLAADLV